MIYIVLAIFGLALGSFVNALTWRLHEQEQELDKKLTAKRRTYLKELSVVTGRSMCPDCHHQLFTKDLVPILSWLMLRGKCRYCGKSISWQYPLVEALTASLFIFSYIYWPESFHGGGLVEFIVWLICLVGFMALAVYDLRWYLLPNRIVYPLLILAVVQVIVVSLFWGGGVTQLLGSFWGVLIGAGIFYAIFQVSDGKWIGGGDVKLGALLGILVGGPLAACLLLFLASLSGSVVSLPLMATGKVKRTTLVPFGPFLLFAGWIVRLFGASMLSWLRTRAIVP